MDDFAPMEPFGLGTCIVAAHAARVFESGGCIESNGLVFDENYSGFTRGMVHLGGMKPGNYKLDSLSLLAVKILGKAVEGLFHPKILPLRMLLICSCLLETQASGRPLAHSKQGTAAGRPGRLQPSVEVNCSGTGTSGPKHFPSNAGGITSASGLAFSLRIEFSDLKDGTIIAGTGRDAWAGGSSLTKTTVDPARRFASLQLSQLSSAK